MTLKIGETMRKDTMRKDTPFHVLGHAEHPLAPRTREQLFLTPSPSHPRTQLFLLVVERL